MTPALQALLLACSLHSDQPLVSAVATAFSAGNPNMTRNVSFQTQALNSQDERLTRYRAASPQAVRRAVKRILARHGTPVIGLLPTPLAWATLYDRDPTQLLDPCVNIRVATAQLSLYEHQCSEAFPKAKLEHRRACTLDLYSEAVRLPGLRFVVLSALTARPLPPPKPSARAKLASSHASEAERARQR